MFPGGSEALVFRMPLHFTDDFILDGGDVEELNHQPPDGAMGQRCFEKLLSQDPNAIVMVESISGKEITTREYLEQCVELACGFRELGVTKGTHVCFVGENTIDICSAAMAVLFLGGITAPLDPAMRAFEYKHMFGLIEPVILICDVKVLEEIDKGLQLLPSIAVKICTIQENDSDILSLAQIRMLGKQEGITVEDFKAVSGHSDDVCAIVGSSGSTGLPKAVQLTNRNLLFTVALVRRPMDSLPRADLLHVSHFFWITGLFLIFTCLYVGVRRIIVEHVNELNVLKAIEKYQPLFGLMSPTLLNALIQHPEFKEYDTSSLLFVVSVGSPLQMSTADLVKKTWTPKIAQGYGLTELAGCYLQPRPDLDIAGIGCPSPGTSIKVVDVETGVNLPVGEEGELCCKSLGLMKGYLKNPQATAEAIDQDGWLHTGDLGYVSDKMTVYITGRIKELMKLDNHQIAPAEIEQLINTVRGVADVGVAGIQISEHSRIPMALVVKMNDSDVSEEDIVKCVNENLSDFKQLRAGVVFVDSIPRTTTGKIKRKLLQELADELYLGDSSIIL